MKKYHKLGYVAAAWAAFACAMIALPAAAVDDVYSIERHLDPTGQAVNDDLSVSNPLLAGQKVMFKLRLLNRTELQTRMGNGAVTNKWDFSCLNGPANWDEVVAIHNAGGDWLTALSDYFVAHENPLQIGVWVNGCVKPATVESFEVVSGDGTDTGYPYYTEMICSYMVENGDFALPLKLAVKAGGRAVEYGTTSLQSEYYLYNTEYWAIKNASNDVCTLRFNNDQNLQYAPNDPGFNQANVDLVGVGLYVKTVDFDDSYSRKPDGSFDPGSDVWFEVPQNGTVGQENRHGPVVGPGLATVNGQPVANGNDVKNLYVWVDDETQIKFPDSVATTAYTFFDGSTHHVRCLQLRPTETNITFMLEAPAGATEGSTTRVYLSSTPTNIYNEAQTLIPNFVSRLVKVGPPDPPKIKVTINDSTTDSTLAVPSDNGYVAQLFITPTAAFSNEFTVTLAPELASGSGEDPWAFIGLSTANGESEGYLKRETTLTFPANSTASKSLYVYASRTSPETADLANGIRFVPTLPDPLADDFYKNNAAAKLRISSAPVIESPTELDTTLLDCNVDAEIKLKVADLFGELTNTYTVKWIDKWDNSSAPPLSAYNKTFSGLIPDGERNLNVTNKFTSSGSKTSWFYVINSDGSASAPQKTTFVVSEPRGILIPTINDAAYEYADPPIVAEGDQVKVSFQFSPSVYEGTTAYLFLVPQSADASNCVAYASGTGGWDVSRTEIRSNTGTATILLKALDGFREDANFRPEFKVVLRTASNWEEGEDVPEWSSDENTRLTFGVTNVAPVVAEVRYGTLRLNGTTRLAGGNVYLGMVPASKGIVVDVPATFSIPSTKGVNEPSQLDLTDTNTLFSTVWVWENEGTEDKMYGNPQGTNITHTFTSAGTNQVSVYMWDKDMDDYEYGATFDVVVSEAPAITITSDDGVTIFPEADGHNSERNLTISLGTLPPGNGNSVTVSLLVRRTDSRTSTVMPTLNVTNYVFKNNETTSKPGAVKLTPLDGPGNFEIYACVTNTGDSPYGVSWQQLYPENSEFKFSVENQKPVLNASMFSETNNASINMVTEIPWELSDVWADMTNGMNVTWSVDGAQKESYILDDVVYVPYSGVFTNVFTDPGVHTVVLRVTDKDKASQSWTYYYEVEQSKSLFLYPVGPSGGLGSEFTQKYTSQGVIGAGRVWASGTAPSLISDFDHTWTFGPKAQDPLLYAHGYRVGDRDNGSLTPGTDWAIDSSGNWDKDRNPATFDNWYTYNPPDGLDSFFYCWILNTGEDGGTFTAARLGGFHPELLSTDNGKTAVRLPAYEENSDEPYENTHVEALFSKEWQKTDNAGDINADGIPDVFAVRFWGGAGQTLFEFCGFDAANAGDLGSLMSKEHKNDDLDYLPRKAHGADPLNRPPDSLAPDTEENWTTMGEPFTTILEIRGFHNGLNLRNGNGAKQGPYTTGAWISDRDYSPAEYQAWTNAYNKAKAAGFTGTIEEFELGKDGFGPWSPENRTDPTTADTDGDGLEDGYEYYFWYYAHVGWIGADGKLRQLEGEKFSLDDISKGIRMPPEEIERLFNPNDAYSNGDGDASTRDADGDGLTDLEELAWGTNPIHWDTDGDGVSDLWEVLRGIDPLTAELGEDAANLDNDYMAYAEITDKCALISVSNAVSGAVSLYAVTNIGDGLLVGSDGTFNPDVAEGAVAIPVYRYGRPDVSPLVPLNRGKWESKDFTTLAGSKTETVSVSTCVTNKPLQAEVIDWTGATTTEDVVDNTTGDTTTTTNYLVEVKLKQTLALVHDQVRAEFGFDPRTAWFMNINGFVANRWDPINTRQGWNGYLAKNKVGGYIGLAQNTKPYLNEDEYLLLKYHYKTRPADQLFDVKFNPKDGGDVTYDVERDKAAVIGANDTLENIFLCGTTHCSTNSIWTKPVTATEYSAELVPHGADSDGNGVPDGWEAYVGFNPSHNGSDGLEGSIMTDGTGLCLAGNYAGTDSCGVYENVESIIALHPGMTRGWYNKFWPTDPWNGDTDGDGISDETEGSTWQGSFSGASDEDNSTYTFTFIYGSPEDDGGLCIRGGGMNPCTVDTDFDNLPDTWEMLYAGVVFGTAGQPVSADAAYLGAADGSNSVASAAAPAQISDAAIQKMRRNDRLGTGATALGYYISGGMDATHGPNPGLGDKHSGDAFTASGYTDPRTGTTRNFDFDNDGLQNYQEYLVQTLRHLRYDDCETPLMGRSYISPGNEQQGPFIPLHYMDGDTFFAEVQGAGYSGSSAWNFRELGYFARPLRPWDPMANRGDRFGTFSEGDEPGFRLMLPPQLLQSNGDRKPATGYACTDPRKIDTDGDGMDDYYELFHGLNPLLGTVDSGDIISGIYGGAIFTAFWNNAWTGWPGILGMPIWLDETVAYTYFDAVKYPWIMGTLEADADGDGIRNAEEALRPNVASPQTTHTDPTPLWMTDSTSEKSFTSQYYRWPRIVENAPDELAGYWKRTFDADGESGYMFAFEENEGYDTDGDGIPDGEELQLTSTDLSDPLKFTDPDRRQAIWFPGNQSAAITRNSDARRGVGATTSDFLRQFTVEAWIRPEDVGREQVIIERVAIYGASTISNNYAHVKANFRIGIAADGRLYGLFDTSDAVPTDTDSPKVLGNIPTVNEWTHVALTYDGSQLALYINGTPMQPTKTSLIPANGIILETQEAMVGGFSEGWVYLPCAVLLGAQANSSLAMSLSPLTTWGEFSNYYAGYVDEVRVWDGARTKSQIEEDMNKRYSFADVAAKREETYQYWLAGATRNNNDGNKNLPAELVMHYNFQTLPGAVNAADVAWEPSGFTKNVVDNVRQDGYPIDGDIYCGWWKQVSVHSTVYKNYRLVPWIRNTCAQLPVFDGSCVDSQYWSEQFAGMALAGEAMSTTFTFPNSANPYPYFIHQGEGAVHNTYLGIMMSVVGGDSEDTPQRRYSFDRRCAFVGNTALVPLGGAFAKRVDKMWDGEGSADAWTMTGKDFNANGIPDWWELIAKGQYGAPEGFDWNTPVHYNGREMSAREAYLRDLMKGRLPDGSINEVFADTSDTNMNGLPDWWENMKGLAGVPALSDSDNDGLADYSEFLISESYSGFPLVNPASMFSFSAHNEVSAIYAPDGQKVPDYFLRVGQLYLGELFGDHDFMDDYWEDQHDPDKVSRYTFDAWTDPDGDGWSNFAEARAASDPTRIAHLGVDNETLKDFPVPVIRATVVYNGQASVAPVVVRAWRNDVVGRRPDAVWTIAADAATTLANTGTNSTGTTQKQLGLNPLAQTKLTLGPGTIVPGTVQIMFKDVTYYNVSAQIYYDSQSNVVNEAIRSTTLGEASGASWVLGVKDRARVSNPEKGDLMAVSLNNILGIVGEIDYRTGEMTVDFSQLDDDVQYDRTVDPGGRVSYKICHLENSYVKVYWTSLQPQQGFPMTLCLTDPMDPILVDSLGRLREGKNIFDAYIDSDNDGAYTPGEPYGVAKDVEVGWSGTTMSIELTDTVPQMARIDLAKGVTTTDFASANKLTDRGVNGSYYNNLPVAASGIGTNTPSSSEVHLRIIRSYVNGEYQYGGKEYDGAVFDAAYDLAYHPVITERVLLGNGLLDLDWGTLVDKWTETHNSANKTALTNVAYRIVLADGTIDAYTVNNNYPLMFVNAFEYGSQQTLAVPVSPRGTIYAGQPEFAWTHEARNAAGRKVKDYPAFRLRVWSEASGGTPIYDSGALPVPPRDEAGAYRWRAPIYANMVLPSGAIFSTTNNYWWSVSMLDAKFTTPNTSETRQQFRLEASGALATISDYGAIKVCVRYFGPSGANGTIRVQAFTTPDFTGVPAGEGYVTDRSALASISDLTPNAMILGVKPGTYYVRAFIDADGDNAWSKWETWGYANNVGTEMKPLYTPRSIKVAAQQAVPVATVYMEDMDSDADTLPDAWEWLTYGTLDSHGSPSGATFFTRVNPNLTSYISSFALGDAGRPSSVRPMTLMNTMLTGSNAESIAAAVALMGDGQVASGDVAVLIDAFSLADGLDLTVTSDVEGVSSGASTLFTVADSADVKVVLVAAKTPDFSDARETVVKTMAISAKGTSTMKVSAEEIAKAIRDADLGDAAFFKVRLEQ